jgi:1-aminocyclopropane-1-carboxylate deaminase/D-cysteine desulfhydrase-like pyridoxal-dependent ACC family enzyme
MSTIPGKDETVMSLSRPRLHLALTPTPLQHLQRLSAETGVEFWLKRDDLTGDLGLGGNKVRKLEFLLAEAVAAGATHVLTTGGPQSNHARATAAACARLGLGCVLVLAGRDPGERQG